MAAAHHGWGWDPLVGTVPGQTQRGRDARFRDRGTAVLGASRPPERRPAVLRGASRGCLSSPRPHPHRGGYPCWAEETRGGAAGGGAEAGSPRRVAAVPPPRRGSTQHPPGPPPAARRPAPRGGERGPGGRAGGGAARGRRAGLPGGGTGRRPALIHCNKLFPSRRGSVIAAPAAAAAGAGAGAGAGAAAEEAAAGGEGG